jgi:hypothetical protein
MPPQTVESRLDSLEKRVTTLERLPVRIDGLTLQVSQLRAEMRAGFSAVRSEIGELGAQMRVLHEDVISRIALQSDGSNGRRSRGRQRKR